MATLTGSKAYSESHDALTRILRAYRTKVRRYVKAGTTFGTEEVLGCSRAELHKFIQDHFKGEMCWKNYGEVWCFANRESPSSYDLTQSEQFMGYFNYSSFKPVLLADSGWNSRAVGAPVLKEKKNHA